MIGRDWIVSTITSADGDGARETGLWKSREREASGRREKPAQTTEQEGSTTESRSFRDAQVKVLTPNS